MYSRIPNQPGDLLFHAGRVFFVGSMIAPAFGPGVINGAPGILILVASLGQFLGTWAGIRILTLSGYPFAEICSDFVWSTVFQANIPMLIILNWKALRTHVRPPTWLLCWAELAAIHATGIWFTREFSVNSGVLLPYVIWIMAIFLLCSWLIFKSHLTRRKDL
jgi:hypothetical protein